MERLRQMLPALDDDRVVDLCERRGVSGQGAGRDRRERLLASFESIDDLIPLLHRRDLVACLEYPNRRGRYLDLMAASRDQLIELFRLVCTGDPRARTPSAPIRFEPAADDGRISEKVQAVGVQRRGDLIYYVKDGDIWASPRRSRAGTATCVRRVGLPMDHATYLYFVDGDGDIARKRRDGQPLGSLDGSDARETVRTAAPLRVFVVYARPERESLDDFLDALASYEHGNHLRVFADTRLTPGEEWDPALRTELVAADIVVFLLTNAFFRKDAYCQQKEVPLALERHRRGECAIMQVLVKACRFDLHPELSKLHISMPGAKSVDEHDPRDPAWLLVTHDLDKVIAKLEAHRARR